jgi:GT2 family glycosyltransferase
MTEPTVSIIIPNYNGEDLLKNNLPQVIKCAQNSGNKIIEVIVVDDFSTDGSVALLKNKFPEVKLIKHKKNRGFSASINTGARAAKGNLILLINTDVSPDEGLLLSVFPLFNDKKVFAVSLHEKGYGWARGFLKDGFVGHGPGSEENTSHITFWVSGGSGIFRRDYWMRLGGLDEKIFSPFYWEDLDICYRAQKRGFINLWEPGAKVTHNHESTISKLPTGYVNLIKERNQLLFNWKNLTSARLFRKHLAGLFGRTVRHPGYIKIFFVALLRLGPVLLARRKEKKETKISDEAIFARFTSTPR